MPLFPFVPITSVLFCGYLIIGLPWNTYALFAEHNWQVLGPRGSAGFIVPSGIATDDTTKEYFQAIMREQALRTMWEFENEGFFASAGQGHMLRFALTTIGGPSRRARWSDHHAAAA